MITARFKGREIPVDLQPGASAEGLFAVLQSQLGAQDTSRVIVFGDSSAGLDRAGVLAASGTRRVIVTPDVVEFHVQLRFRSLHYKAGDRFYREDATLRKNSSSEFLETMSNWLTTRVRDHPGLVFQTEGIELREWNEYDEARREWVKKGWEASSHYAFRVESIESGQAAYDKVLKFRDAVYSEWQGWTDPSTGTGPLVLTSPVQFTHLDLEAKLADGYEQAVAESHQMAQRLARAARSQLVALQTLDLGVERDDPFASSQRRSSRGEGMVYATAVAPGSGSEDAPEDSVLKLAVPAPQVYKIIATGSYKIQSRWPLD